MKIQNKKTLVGVFTLITIEQVIKIVINNNFLYKTYPILAPFLYFEPMFNRQYSWTNAMLELGVSRWIHIAYTAIIIIVLYLFYHYLNKQSWTNKIINIMYVFLFSGAMCSLIDKIFWNGSLDYILVKGFFTFDLKDIYINIFIAVLILSSLLEHKVLRKINGNDIVRGFIKYIKEGDYY